MFNDAKRPVVCPPAESKTKSVRPTEARAGDAPALSAAMAALGWLSYRMQAPLVRAMRPCFSAGRAHRARKSGTEPNERAPTPVLASSLYHATRQGWGPHIIATDSALPMSY